MRSVPALAEGKAGPPRAATGLSHGLIATARAQASPSYATPLPPETGFLTAYGIDPGVLVAAATRARAQGVSAEAVLLGEGLVSEATYYRALAQHCRVRWLDAPARLSASVRFPQAVHAGAAELAALSGARWLMAPRGKAIARLIAAARQTPPGLAKPFALTSPQQLSELVQNHCRRERLAEASHGLARTDPALSAYSPGIHLGAQLFVALIVLVTLLAALSTLASQVVALGCGLLFSAGTFARLCAMISAPEREAVPNPSATDALLPSYTILVPLYDEADVIGDLVAALDRLDYPKSRLDIKLVVEERDEVTRAAIAALSLPARYETIVAPEGKPRTKPRALNMALPLAHGEFLVVFDAEDRPDPQQLRLAAAHFARAPEIACLQARLAIDNTGESWLTGLFALEYAALFDVLDPGLCKLGLPLPLGGTSNHFRDIM